MAWVSFHLLFSFENVLEDLGDFSDHRHQESVICLVHESFVVFDLVIKLFLDVVLHLVGDESACNFISNLADQREVVRGKVLVTFFVGDLEDTYCMVAKLDWDKKDIPHDLMQLLVHCHILAKLLPHTFVLRPLKVSGLSSVKDLAENIRLVTLSFERDWLSQSASDHFAEKLVFHSVV